MESDRDAIPHRRSSRPRPRRREGLLDALIEECRPHAPDSFRVAGDLGERAFAESAVAVAIERAGRLDVVVNNAAISKHKHALAVLADEIERVMRVNFFSAVWTTLAALPHFLRAARRHGGDIKMCEFNRSTQRFR